MNALLQKLMLGGSTAALFAAMPMVGALAQSGSSNSDIEQVVVSASRITIAGYTQPTPVTVVGAAQLEKEAAVDIGDTIRELPAVGQSSGPSNGVGSGGLSGAGSGLDQVNLRNLGILRTLVLFDGQRVVQANITGGADLSTMPTTLVERVDIVTGGASAAWGSDAVAGVVNLILNKNFTGFKGNAEGSDTEGDTFRTTKFEGSWGSDFDGTRGHVILSAGYSGSPDTVWEGQAKWLTGAFLMSNPAWVAGNGQPQVIAQPNVGFSNATPGGIITASPAVASTATAANALRGIQFLGTAATPSPYNFGNITASYCYSCSGSFYTTGGWTNALAAAYHTTTLFGYGSYKITDSIKASMQLNWGQSYAQSNASDVLKEGNLTILSGNPFIPASIQAIMTADKIPSFTFGTTNLGNINPHDNSWQADENSVGAVFAQSTRQLQRGVFTLDGVLGDDWGWDIYYQAGTNRVNLHAINNTDTGNFNNAINAVTVTAANVGTSHLAIGNVTCASTLTNPTNGCVPLDVFGIGVASAAAITYINPPGQDVEHLYLTEEVASGSLQGTLPWGFPAGKAAVAFGAEYRHEGGRITADPLGATAGWASGNFTNFAGQYYIYEGFAEVDAPLIKDEIVQSLDFNAAGRITDYSTSGLVETWKVGLTSQVDDDIRLRTTWSYDIRAGDLSELFSGSQLNTTQGIIDPKTGIPVSVVNDKSGNTALQPEDAISIIGGIALTPHWIDGLSLSLDWYSINIKNAIYTASSTSILQQCAAGNAIYCSQLVFNGTEYPGALSQINTAPINAASETDSGLDFQGDYNMDLFSGTLNWHLIGNYTDEETETATGIKADFAGSLSGDSTLGLAGFPKFRGTLAATYTEGRWSGTVQGRFIGAAHINNAWSNINFVANNDIPFVGYLDLRGSFKWNDSVQLYGAINNFTDAPPPSVPQLATSGGGNQNVGTLPALYDALGRVYRAGVRVTFQ